MAGGAWHADTEPVAQVPQPGAVQRTMLWPGAVGVVGRWCSGDWRQAPLTLSFSMTFMVTSWDAMQASVLTYTKRLLQKVEASVASCLREYGSSPGCCVQGAWPHLLFLESAMMKARA